MNSKKVTKSKRKAIVPALESIPSDIKPVFTKHEYGRKVLTEMLTGNHEIPSGSRYEFYEEIGEGAQGAVFKGNQISECDIRKKVAIKVLKNNYGEKEIKRLVKEAKILQFLSQGNIVEMLALECLPFNPVVGHKTYVLIEELIEGMSFEKLLSLHRQKNILVHPKIVAFILYKAALALDEAHSLKKEDGASYKLVHRSLSSSNILLNEKAGIIKLSDFGMAVIDNDELDAGALKGKPQYMAPEQFLGKNFSSSDIWALGVIGYEALTGFMPYQISGKTLSEATDRFVAQSHFELRSPAQILSEKTVDANFKVLSDLIMNCLNPNGHKRPTADHVQYELASNYLYKEGLGPTNKTLVAYLNLMKKVTQDGSESFKLDEESTKNLVRTLYVNEPKELILKRVTSVFVPEFVKAIQEKHRNPCLKPNGSSVFE